jgi:hypothetical protein
MNRHFAALVWTCILVLLPATQASAELTAGAAKADITPTKWPHPMVGSFSERLADKAWDPLHARAIVLSDGSTKLAIVVVDSCYCPRSLFDEAKRRVEKQCGIRTYRILGSATHTHTAPASRDRRETKADPQYVEQVTAGIVQAVVQAHQNLEPAEIGWGKVAVPEELFNRRWYMKPGGIVPNPFGGTDDIVRMNPPRSKELLDRPAGPTDPDVSVVSIRSREGRPIALLANYSLHYVGGIPAGGVSADYFGEFARLVEKQLGSQGNSPPVVGIMSNGTSGDVNNINFTNPRPRSQPFERMRIVAKRVADASLKTYETIQYRSDISLAASQRLLTLNKRRPNAEQVRRAKEFLAAEDESSLPKRAKPYARWLLQLNEPPFEEEIVLQAFRIGELGIAAIPCEVFTEIGLELKDKSPLPTTFTIELANGHYGYLPTPRQHALGGYETWLGTCILETTASDKITAVVLELLDEVAVGK